MRFDRVSNLSLIALLSLLTTFSIGCQRPPLWDADILRMSDPTIARQLLFGFYGVDEGRWRWTGRVFGVALATSTAVQNPSKKTFQIGVDLYFPQPEIDQLGPITLTAIAAECQLGQQKFERGGAYQFVVDVPVTALCTNVFPVTFYLDKSLPPSNADWRDLGTVVTTIRLWSRS